MKKVGLVGVCLLVLIGCKQKKDSSVEVAEEEPVIEVIVQKELPTLEEGEVFLKNRDPFTDIVELKGEILQPDTFIFQPREPAMYIKDNYLIMKNLGEYPFLLFNYPDLTFNRYIGRRGNGPDEFGFPNVIPTNDPDVICYLFEANRDQIYRLTHTDEIISLPFRLSEGPQKAFGEQKSIYHLGGYEFLYVKSSPTGKSVYRTDFTDDSLRIREVVSLQLNPRRKSPYTYIGDFAVNPAKNRMVYAYKYFKVIKFMDLEAGMIRTLNFQQDGYEDRNLTLADGMDNNVTHYWGICAGDEYVYCMYSGRTPMQVGQDARKGILYIYVEVYDWNGNPVQKYKLDKWGIVTVDEKNKRLILLDFGQDDPFAEYILPEF